MSRITQCKLKCLRRVRLYFVGSSYREGTATLRPYLSCKILLYFDSPLRTTTLHLPVFFIFNPTELNGTRRLLDTTSPRERSCFLTSGLCTTIPSCGKILPSLTLVGSWTRMARSFCRGQWPWSLSAQASLSNVQASGGGAEVHGLKIELFLTFLTYLWERFVGCTFTRTGLIRLRSLSTPQAEVFEWLHTLFFFLFLSESY